jgi:hypothetical protein
MEYALKATRTTTMPRKNRVYDLGRVCLNTECETKLSRYNKRDKCSVHASVHFPRLRGHTKHLSE